jgi:hypothetical protein
MRVRGEFGLTVITMKQVKIALTRFYNAKFVEMQSREEITVHTLAQASRLCLNKELTI